MDKLIHRLLHFGAHAASHAYKHHKHKKMVRSELERNRAYQVSEFAGIMYDFCQSLGYGIVELDSELVVYSCNERGLCIGNDDNGLACYAFTPFQFHIRIPDDVIDFLDSRNEALEYGEWGLPEIGDHKTAVYALPIKIEDFDPELFGIVSQMAYEEREAVERIFLNAGFHPSV